MDDRERFAEVQHRLDAMVADPSWRTLRSMVPPGRFITPALASEVCEDAGRRAAADCGGLPAFLAVGEPDREELTFLILEEGPSGKTTVRRPGDWAAPPRPATRPGETLGEVIALFRAANEGDPRG